MEHGWRVTAEDSGTLMERYGRPPSRDRRHPAEPSSSRAFAASAAYSDSWNSTIAVTVSTASLSAPTRAAALGAASTA